MLHETMWILISRFFYIDLQCFQKKIISMLSGTMVNMDFTLYLLVSSSDNLCKQFGPRSGPTKCRAWSGSKLFDTLMVFIKEFFIKVDFEKISRRQKSMQNIPACRVKVHSARVLNSNSPTSCVLFGWYGSSSVSSKAGFRLPPAALPLLLAFTPPPLPSRSEITINETTLYS